MNNDLSIIEITGRERVLKNFKKFEYLKLFCDIIFCIVNITKVIVLKK
jgi:hypothetical protein